MPSLEELRERFREDRYATQLTGADIPDGKFKDMVDAAANGFAERITVSQHVSVTFLAPAKGRELRAEARCVKAGRTTCLYEVEVRDEAGTFVAQAMVNGFTI